jgi:phosphoribosylformylglycinamidine cyclo-ligase
MNTKVPKENKSLSYKNSGVNVEAGYKLVNKIKPLVKETKRPEIISGLGSFSALSKLPSHIDNPILVTCTDGVGTKIEIAKAMKQFNTIGIDLVAMCVNDLITCGAEPLLFLDYYVTDKLNVDLATEVISGIAEGCKQANCSLVGGETAEHPDSFPYQSFDLAGFALGIVDQKKIIGQNLAEKGDVLIGLASNGVHSNGFSLIRKIINKDPQLLLSNIQGETVGSRLLTPTKIYVKEILELKEKIEISAISHISGGGFYENIPRILNSDSKAILSFNETEWPAFKLFEWIRSKGEIQQKEMLSTFNCGIGMVLSIKENDVNNALDLLEKLTIPSKIIGTVEFKKKEEASLDITLN